MLQTYRKHLNAGEDYHYNTKSLLLYTCQKNEIPFEAQHYRYDLHTSKAKQDVLINNTNQCLTYNHRRQHLELYQIHKKSS